MPLPMREAIVEAVTYHHQVKPPYGTCRCGHEAPLGTRFGDHIADEALKLAGWAP